MSHAFCHNHTPKSGFTLIEVLIATFVIALGSLGLLALFAGAASQQRVASQTTAAVIVSKNAEAIVSPRFGRIDGTLFDGLPSPNDLDTGVWFVVPADDDGNLSINPNPDDVEDRREAYFLLERNEATTLFDLPLTTQWRQIALGRGFYRRDGQGPDGTLFNVSPYSIRPFPVSRIDGRAISTIRVITNDKPLDNDPAYNYQGEVSTRFIYVNTNYAANRPTGWPTNAPFSNQGEYALFTTNGALPGDTQPFILLKRMEDPSENDALSEIEQFNLRALVEPVPGNPQFHRHIQRIEVPRVVYRSAEVISARDRVVEVRDPDFDAGVRPDIGYSLLYRKLASGSSQIAIFTYFIQGSDRSGRFLLEESESDSPGPFGADSGSATWGLQMLGGVVLAWDDDREQYYFEAESDEEIDALEPGAVLLVSGEPEGTANRVIGADLPVRVVRQIRSPDGNGFRSYINRVPRSAGQSMLPFRNQTKALNLWTIRRDVESTDGSEWSLRPRELRIFNVN